MYHLVAYMAVSMPTFVWCVAEAGIDGMFRKRPTEREERVRTRYEVSVEGG
jgi:hypothetical protein